MITGDDLLERLDYGLHKTGKDFPAARLFIWSLHKHIHYALHNPAKRRLGKLIPKARKWLAEMKWKHPQFKYHFEPLIDLIDEFEKQ